MLTLAIYDLVYAINKKKRLRIYNLFGSNNSSGFVNSCVTKTGFPNAVVFTDNGAEYDPYQINSNVLMKNVDLQLYFSNFSETPNKNFFKKNIFLGNPNAKNKKKFDVYIPTKTPGVDKNGLSVRSDGISIIKHKQVLDSSYKSIKEILTQI